MIPLRDENPSRTTPYLTRILIAVNVIIYFLAWISGSANVTSKYGIIDKKVDFQEFIYRKTLNTPIGPKVSLRFK